MRQEKQSKKECKQMMKIFRYWKRNTYWRLRYATWGMFDVWANDRDPGVKDTDPKYVTNIKSNCRLIVS